MKLIAEQMELILDLSFIIFSNSFSGYVTFDHLFCTIEPPT